MPHDLPKCEQHGTVLGRYQCPVCNVAVHPAFLGTLAGAGVAPWWVTDESCSIRGAGPGDGQHLHGGILLETTSDKRRTSAGRIAITQTFDVECIACGCIIDSRPTYARAVKAAQLHRREAHKGDGIVIGGKWTPQ